MADRPRRETESINYAELNSKGREAATQNSLDMSKARANGPKDPKDHKERVKTDSVSEQGAEGGLDGETLEALGYDEQGNELTDEQLDAQIAAAQAERDRVTAMYERNKKLETLAKLKRETAQAESHSNNLSKSYSKEMRSVHRVVASKASPKSRKGSKAGKKGKSRREQQQQDSDSEFEDCSDEDGSDDEDGSGSGEESNVSSAGEEFNSSHSKKKKKLKSGRYRKMGSKIKKDVIWAHELLKFEHTLQDRPDYDSLSFPLLCAGELEIIRRCERDSEVCGRANLLRRCAYIAYSHSEEASKAVYHAVLQSIETGDKRWSSNFNYVEQSVLSGYPARARSSKATQGKSGTATTPYTALGGGHSPENPGVFGDSVLLQVVPNWSM